jgi:hypothetical protein
MADRAREAVVRLTSRAATTSNTAVFFPLVLAA